MPRMIKVKPVESDLKIASFNDGVWMTDDSATGEGTRNPEKAADLQPAEETGSAGAARRQHRLTRFFTTWTSTVPDAVGITGIRYITSSHHHILRRAVWLMALLGGLTAAGYQIIDRAVFYAGNPKSVDVEIKYVNKPTFPAVTICNYNKYKNVFGHLAWTPFGQLVTAYASLKENSGQLNFTAYESQLAGVNTTELYLDLAHQIGDMFLFGTWDGHQWLIPANFTRIFTDIGVCYTFNAGRNGQALLSQNVAGRQSGLDILLDAQQLYYFFNKQFSGSAGFLVAVHDQNEVPEVDALGVGVPPGSEARIGVRTKQTDNLPPPHGECGSRNLKYLDGYTVNKCRKDCLIDFVLTACGCVEPYMAVSGDMKVCDPIEVYSCVYSATERFNTEGECECPVPCSITSYATSLSYTRFPSTFHTQKMVEYYSTVLGVQIPDNYYPDNMVRIIVYLEELAVDHLKQQTDYTFFAFLCDIGGAIGLWLGGSVLTIIEILDHLTYTTFIPGSSTFQYKTG